MAAPSPSVGAGTPTVEETTESTVQDVTMDGEGQEKVQLGPVGKAPSISFDQALYTKLFDPVMADMKKTVGASSKILDRIGKQMDEERAVRVKKNRTTHVPDVLKGGGLELDAVLRKVEKLIFFAEVEGLRGVQLQDHIRLPDLDLEAKTSVVANSLKTYLTTLPETELKILASKINSDCQMWLSSLFRFEDPCVLYHDDEHEGLVRICRLALCLHYPKYATDGFDALYSRPPVIYLSAAASTELGQYLCRQLGLPVSCISIVPCNTVFGASSKMDVAMLEKLIQDDITAAKTPVLLLAFAGTPVAGHVDNLQRLQDICETNSIWLHVEGSYLATLPLLSEPTDGVSVKTWDSITITPGSWLGVPGLPCATVFKSSDATLMHAAGLNTFNTALRLNCLPYWMSFLTLGHDGVITRITQACELAKHLYDQLDEIVNIKQITRNKKGVMHTVETKSLMETISTAINALLVFEMASPTVVFRYSADNAGPVAIASPYTVKEDQEQAARSDESIFFDALNLWLSEALQSSDPSVAVETVVVEKEGVCVRFCPLETAHARGTTKEDIDHFVKSLMSNVTTLNTSIQQRKRFEGIVTSHPNLRFVHLQKWAGLGAVRYIPDMYLNQEELEEKDQEAVDNHNCEMWQQLQDKNYALSLGETDTGSICVKIGFITDSTNIDQLMEMVQMTGQEVEESSRFLENMTDIIQKGIVAANRELQKENEHKLLQEGVLRQIPMVSSMLNWWSPIKEEVRGRAFNLTSGKILPTQDTYKYHIQVQEEEHPPLQSNGTAATSTTGTAVAKHGQDDNAGTQPLQGASPPANS